MKKSRFTEEQIIAILREQEAGMKTADVCRKHGISNPTFYAWKAKYGGMDVSQARKLKVLDEENARLKRLLADAMLGNAVLKEVAAKTGEACRSAQGGRARSRVLRHQRAMGLCHPGRGSKAFHPHHSFRVWSNSALTNLTTTSRDQTIGTQMRVSELIEQCKSIFPKSSKAPVDLTSLLAEFAMAAYGKEGMRLGNPLLDRYKKAGERYVSVHRSQSYNSVIA